MHVIALVWCRWMMQPPNGISSRSVLNHNQTVTNLVKCNWEKGWNLLRVARLKVDLCLSKVISVAN